MNTAIDMNPGQQGASAKTSPAGPVTEKQKEISSLIKSGAPADAIKLIKTSGKSNWSSRDWFLYGQALFRLLKFRKALQAFRTGLKEDPGNMLAVHYCGLCLERLKKYRKALKHYKIAQSAIPEAGNKVMFFAEGGLRQLRRRDRFERRMRWNSFLMPVLIPLVLAILAFVLYMFFQLQGSSGNIPAIISNWN